MPEQVAMAFEVFSRKIEFNYFVAALAKPFHKKRHLFVARGKTHAAGDNEFADFVMLPDED